ncbi:MAG: hypothetical protein JW932_01915, partial [Deltaproteobacteria bacterium]|nr:hypothetical protein [Deltaproteobacteria bacterium]
EITRMRKQKNRVIWPVQGKGRRGRVGVGVEKGVLTTLPFIPSHQGKGNELAEFFSFFNIDATSDTRSKWATSFIQQVTYGTWSA